MLLEMLLRLRNGRERVSVINRPGSTRPELGTALPQEDDRRARAAAQWGAQHESPRTQPLATIDQPLPTRTQTILSHGLPPEVRAAINGDVTDALPASRDQAGRVSVKLRLDR